MSKEEILSQCDNLDGYLHFEDVSEAMDIHAEKVAVAFAEWMAAPGLHPEICAFMMPLEKYQYFINNIYNK